MNKAFSAKLALVLKILSMSRSQLAAELGIDKSVTSRWVSGAVRPSAHNLTQLTAMIARRVEGFTILDWDRDLESLGRRLGADVSGVIGSATQDNPKGIPLGLPLGGMDQILATTAIRGGAYEGFFRSTRMFALDPRFFMHDHGMIRRDDNGLLRLSMATAGVFVDAWMLPLQNQIFCIGTERATGSPVFGVFNGIGGLKAAVMDGLTLTSILDAGRTPTATAIVLHRIGDLTGDRQADDATFAELAQREAVAPASSVPEALRAHLCRDAGPAAAALGGDWLLRMPLSRSISE